MKKITLLVLIFLSIGLINNVLGGTPNPAKPTVGEVKIGWVTKTVSVCPPGILGMGPCGYPSLQQLFERIRDLLLKISPELLVILLILGGLMYLLVPFKVEDYIKKGHSYIRYAIYGYILLLLISLIFTIISAILGGPEPPNR